MERRFQSTPKYSCNRFLLCMILISSAFMIAGCTGMQIKENRRIELISGSTQSGTDENADYAMQYQYLYDQLNPDGSGRIELKAGVGHKTRLKSLTIAVNWLDGDGKVLESKGFYFSGVNKKHRDRSVAETYKIPPGARSMAFTSVSQRREGR